MGGMAAVLGNLHPEVITEVITSVALGPTNALSYYKSLFPELGQHNLACIYYIVGKNDFLSDYDFPGEAQKLYNVTEEPRKLWILPGSALHGSTLMTHSGVNDSIVAWMKEQMPSR